MNQHILRDEKIIRYLSQELSAEEQEEVIAKMSKDPNFRKQVHQMASIISDTKKARVSPSKNVVQRVLAYLKKGKSVEDESHADQTCTY